jgi:hypothetical protein
MLEFLQGKVSDRKLRLVACGNCRREWACLRDDGRTAVATAERFADGQADDAERSRADDLASKEVEREYRHLELVGGAIQSPPRLSPAEERWLQVLLDESFFRFAVARMASASTLPSPELWEGLPRGGPSYLPSEHSVLKDLFSPLPFRPVTIDPAWLRWNFATVPAIARHAYEDRTYHDLPILADALEDAGCTDPDILTHCRRPGEHVRGCWVVDLLLGKE